MPHRWSGWPGAWCLDCGIEDPVEHDIANGGDGNVTVVSCPSPHGHHYDPYWAQLQNPLICGCPNG